MHIYMPICYTLCSLRWVHEYLQMLYAVVGVTPLSLCNAMPEIIMAATEGI